MDLYKNEADIAIFDDDSEVLSTKERELLNDINSLVDYLVSQSVEILPDESNKLDIRKKYYADIRSGLKKVTEHMSSCTDLICLDDEILISFSDVHELYKSIPKIIVENFRDIESIIMHVHICCQIDESQVSFSHQRIKLYDLCWNDVVKFPNGDMWYCCDDGSTITIGNFTSLIAALDSISRFTMCLQKIAYFLGEATIIMIDDVTLINSANEHIKYISIEDFISDYLTIGNYRFNFNWYWRLPEQM